jgi:O-antigen ligase
VKFPVFSAFVVATGLAYLAFFSGGIDVSHFSHVFAVLSLLGIAVFTRQNHAFPSGLPVMCWFAVLCYLAIQAVPLPLSVVEILSPARAAMTTHLADTLGPQNWSTLSISPADSFRQLFRMAGYFLVFLIARQVASMSTAKGISQILLPFAIVGGVEAALGIAQFLVSSSSAPATGTYVNRNHFGGLLGLLLPPAVAQTAVLLPLAIRRVRRGDDKPHALRASLWSALSSACLAGILCSLSRMSIVACTVSAIVTLYLLYRPGFPRTLSIIGGVALSIAVLIPGVFVDRFAALTVGDGSDVGTRADLWKDTLAIVHAFPLTGSGAGTYETALLPYKTVAPSFDVNFAHNDYLQHLAELGVIGVLPLALLSVVVVWRTFRSAMETSVTEERAVAAGCAGSMVSILIHSTVDFNLYIPANAALLAWIAGLSVALPHVTNAAPTGYGRRPSWIRLRHHSRPAGSGGPHLPITELS